MFPAQNLLSVCCVVLAMACVLGPSGLVLAQPPPTAAQAAKPSDDDSVLRADPALQVKITGDFTTPKAQELVERLRAETKLDITLADNVNREDPVLGSLSCRNVPAWDIMEELAKSEIIKGKWERTDKGYRLTSPLPPVPAKAKSPIQPSRITAKPWRRYYLAGFLFFLILALLLFILRQRQVHQPGPADELRKAP